MGELQHFMTVNGEAVIARLYGSTDGSEQYVVKLFDGPEFSKSRGSYRFDNAMSAGVFAREAAAATEAN